MRSCNVRWHRFLSQNVHTKVYIYIYIYIWKKIMDNNPTICEEKLTTNNPNRKWGFICFSINPHFLFELFVVNIYIYIYIVNEKSSWNFLLQLKKCSKTGKMKHKLFLHFLISVLSLKSHVFERIESYEEIWKRCTNLYPIEIEPW